MDERLLLVLEANARKYERDIARARQRTGKELGAIEAQFLRTRKAVQTSLNSMAGGFGGQARGFLGPIAAAVSIKGAQQLIDAATRIQNALKIAGLEGEALEAVYTDLFISAQRNAAPIETLVQLYSKLALVQKELGVSQQQLIGFTDKVALALRVGGTDAQAASGALLQLSQALGSGTVRAEEFNSVLEGAPTIAQAVAAGLEEAGGSVAKLRQLVVDGKLSSEAFFHAFEAGAWTLEEKVAGAELTVSQAFVRLQNVLIDTAGKLDDATGASSALAEFISGPLAQAISELGAIFTGLNEGPLGTFIGLVSTAVDELIGLAAEIGKLTGLDAVGRYFGATPYQTKREAAYIQDRIDGAHNVGDDSAGTGTGTGTGTRQPTDIGTITKPAPPRISIKDYPALGRSSGGGGRGGRGGGSRASGGDDYQRAIEQAQKRTELLRLETEQLANVNPLLDQYGQAQETAALKAQLLAAAQASGREVTPELAAQIDEIARAYGQAAADAEKLAQEQERVKETAQEIGNLAGSVVSGFISDLRAGKSAGEAFANALNRIIDKLVDMLVQLLIIKPLMSMFGGGLGGLLGFSSGGVVPGFASGGYTGPGGKNTPRGIVHAGEVVWSQDDVRRAGGVGIVEALRTNRVRGFSSGGVVPGAGSSGLASRLVGSSSGAPSFSPTINVNVEAGAGGKPEDRADLARQTAKQIETSIRGLVLDEMRRQTRPGNFANRRGG